MTSKKYNMPNFDIVFVGKEIAISVNDKLSVREQLMFQVILTQELDLCKKHQGIK